MRYQLFGQTGLRVSELALGAMTFGNNKWGADEATSAAIYAAYRDAGGNFLDTANEVYADGRSEEILGRLVADQLPCGSAGSCAGHLLTPCVMKCA